MRLKIKTGCLVGCLLLLGCADKGLDPKDPYEPYNRQIYQFNQAFDATMIKPPTQLYRAIFPPLARQGITNFFNNLYSPITIVNDVLQGELRLAYKDSWRFLANSTVGFAGLVDNASRMGLMPHYNDLGITLAKWGYQPSAYLVLPVLGPSTVRDSLGLAIDYSLFSPIAYIDGNLLFYGVSSSHFIDLRSQFMEQEKLLAEAFDRYALMRDAYLQNRQYQIAGEATQVISASNQNDDYVEEQTDNSSFKTSNSGVGADYVE